MILEACLHCSRRPSAYMAELGFLPQSFIWKRFHYRGYILNTVYKAYTHTRISTIDTGVLDAVKGGCLTTFDNSSWYRRRDILAQATRGLRITLVRPISSVSLHRLGTLEKLEIRYGLRVDSNYLSSLDACSHSRSSSMGGGEGAGRAGVPSF